MSLLDYVEKDQAIAEVDSDKATLELPAEESGTIQFKAEEGDVVKVGQVVCVIDTSAKVPEASNAPAVKKEEVIETLVVEKKEEKTESSKETYATGVPSPAAAKMMSENNVKAGQISGTGKD